LDHGHAVRILVPLLGAPREGTVGTGVAAATHVAQCGVVHLTQVVVRLERGHPRVDLAEPVEVVDHAAVTHRAGASVRRISAASAAGTDTRGGRACIRRVGVIDDHPGGGVPFGIVDPHDAAGPVRIRLLRPRGFGRGYWTDQLLPGAQYAAIAGLATLGQVGEEAVACLLGIRLKQAFGLVVTAICRAESPRVQGAIADLHPDADRVDRVLAVAGGGFPIIAKRTGLLVTAPGAAGIGVRQAVRSRVVRDRRQAGVAWRRLYPVGERQRDRKSVV